MIESCDYDWISILDIMDCMLSAWGSLELAPKFQKTNSSDVTFVASSGVGCAARR